MTVNTTIIQMTTKLRDKRKDFMLTFYGGYKVVRIPEYVISMTDLASILFS